MIECHESGVGEDCPTSHLPETEVTDKASDSTEGKEGWNHAPMLRALSVKISGMVNSPPMNPMTQITVIEVGREALAVVVSIVVGVSKRLITAG